MISYVLINEYVQIQGAHPWRENALRSATEPGEKKLE